jgi:hypothetical protein
LVGTCTIQATQAGNTNYSPAPPVNQSFTVTPESQTITFGALSNQVYGSAPFNVSATASSGLAVSFSSQTSPVCTVSLNTVTLVAGGTCTIQATQAGNTDYSPAPPVSRSFTVTQQTLLPRLSINGGSTSAETPPWTPVSLTFNLYDQANGADDIQWGQFYLVDSTGNAYCVGDWGRPNGLDLYDGNTGVTWGFGISQSDSFCTVSLTSIANSSTDPTEVTVVLSFSFNPGPGGTYTIEDQINYNSGYVGPWEADGTLIVEPATEPVTSPPVYQAPAQSAPQVAPPAPVSNSVSMCGDISGNWTDASNSAWTYSIDTSGGQLTSDSSAAYTDACGTITWQLSGSLQQNGSWQITFSNGSTNACGEYGEPGTANVVPACNAATVTGTFMGTQTQMVKALATSSNSGTTSWTGTSPGLSLTLDLMAGKITTQLTGHKTSDVTVAVANSQGQQVLSIPHSSAQGGGGNCSGNPSAQGCFSDGFRTLLQAGMQYGSVAATWDTTTLSVPVTFYMLGLTHVTQYNTPYHSSCSSNPQDAIFISIISQNQCYYFSGQLGSAFMTSVTTNGTGVWPTSVANVVLKAYAAGAMNICPPYQDPFSDEYFPTAQTFFEVDTGGHQITTITGSGSQVNTLTGGRSNYTLSDATGQGTFLNNFNPPPGSLATDPSATSINKGTTYLYGDAILLVDQTDTKDPLGLRSVQDLCPACTGQAVETGVNTPAHMDLYNGQSQSCNAHSVGDYVGSNGVGQWYAIRLR